MKSGTRMSDLLKKIALGENEQLDFKFRIDDQKKIARTLVAFANTSGGSLLIGVKDNGKIAGVDPEEEIHMIEGAADLYCKPPIQIESKVWQEGHHLVLEIVVNKSEIRHKSIADDGSWRNFYRIEDNTIQGNKILDRVWSYRSSGIDRPESFSDEELGILAVIREEEPVSISKIYRRSELKMAKIDKFISALIHWGVIDVMVQPDGIRYKLSE